MSSRSTREGDPSVEEGARGLEAPAPGTEFQVEAPAKVNLLLRILDRRPDGYHDLETLFQAVGFYDTLRLRVAAGPDVELRVEGADVGPVAENLVLRSVRAFEEATGCRVGLEITLTKRIPAGAGLGGGSSDAGATLRTLNRMWGSPLTRERLLEVAGVLGSDVPFFACDAAYALATGRGEVLTPLPPLPRRTLILALPPVHVATGPAYAALADARADGGHLVSGPLFGGLQDPAPWAEPLVSPAGSWRGPTGALPEPAALPDDWPEVARIATNDFHEVVRRLMPEVDRAISALEGEEAPLVLLSGSGAAVFALPVAGADAADLARIASRVEPDTRFIPVETLAHLPEPRRVDSPGAMD